MIDFIKGNIDYVGEGYIVIENNEIGYKIMTSSFTISDLATDNNKAIVYTEMIVREDAISLCGFATRNELQVFQLLTTVNGVGTKVALGILSAIPYIELARTIINGDASTLIKAPGVGKKTAQRIILELKDKIQKKIELTSIDKLNIEVGNVNVSNGNSEALDALITLGYTKNEAKGVLEKIDVNLPIEEIIKQALRLLMK